MGWMNEAMKIEIGRMLQEGVSDEGIQAVVEDWKRQTVINPYATYATFVEYGLPPIDQSKIVEGSIEKVTSTSFLPDETKHPSWPTWSVGFKAVDGVELILSEPYRGSDENKARELYEAAKAHPESLHKTARIEYIGLFLNFREVEHISFTSKE